MINILCDTIRRFGIENIAMTTDSPTQEPKNTDCQCPACVPSPGRTYTPEYMQECLARWYVNATAEQREKYLAALYKQKGWQVGIANLKAIAERLELPTKDFPN
jgi:hypothetical protein